MLESDKLQETEKEDSAEDKEKKKEEGEKTTLEEQIIERGRKRLKLPL